jgi:hypothetical protein
MNFPANWHIQYSLDGVNYTTVENSQFDIHPAAWWLNTCIKFGTHGLAQRSFLLPAELSGAKKAYLRIAPYTAACATNASPDGGTYDRNKSADLYLAAITIKYNK